MQIEKPCMENCTDKQWENWYWQDFHDLCKSCINKCKQSWKVQLNCTQFKQKEI